MNKKLKKIIAAVLVVVVLAYPSRSWAMLIPPDTNARASDMKVIQTALESKILRQKLADYKLSKEEIDSRLSKLSDDKIHQMATHMNAVAPAGDEGGFVIDILVIFLVVFFIVFLVRRI